MAARKGAAKRAVLTPEDEAHRQEIRDLRHEMGLTQHYIARKLDVYDATVCNWETGKWPIPETALIAIRTICAEAATQNQDG